MEAEHTPRKLRIVSGTAAEVEEQLNRLMPEYAPSGWNFGVIEGKTIITVVLVRTTDLTAARILARPMAGRAQ